MIIRDIILKSVLYGMLGAAALLSVYFIIITLLSGRGVALSQFFQFWYLTVGLAIGFGVQIGLFAYLKNSIHKPSSSGKMLAVSGTTSTGAMVSCCAHYLVNILPVVGVTGSIGLIGQYQVELLWVGLVLNIAGIAYIMRKVIKFNQI